MTFREVAPWHTATGIAQRYGVVVLSLLAAAIFWALLSSVQPAWLHSAQERSSDWEWRLLSLNQEEQRLILVDVDERSLREIGPWPWPRATQAKLINELAAAGAELQVLDIVFAAEQAGDDSLARAIGQHKPVMAQVFALPQQGDNTLSGELAGALNWPHCPAIFTQASGYLANAPGLAGAAQTTGHITPRLSTDGVVRQQPAVLCYQDKSFLALSIAALTQATQTQDLSLQRGHSWKDAPWQLRSNQGSMAPLPLGGQGDLRVPWWRDPASFVSVSAADVLARRAPPGLLKKTWVVVGSSAFGLNDNIATPFSGGASGMQVHAQIITALLDGRLPYTPRADAALQAGAAVSGLLLLTALALFSRQTSGSASRIRFPVQSMPLVALLWGGLLWCAHLVLLQWLGWWVGWLQPAVVVVLAGLVWGMLEHTKSRIDRDRLYTHLSSYLPAPVAAALALQPPSGAINADTRHVSVMFADIRNFSAYCEARPPKEAAAVLHAFFSTATRIIEAQGGVIEAFQGDAVLAVWYGNTVAESKKTKLQTDPAMTHPQRAIQAAVKLLNAMSNVLPDPAPAGLEPLALGIGLESGLAMAGSLGLASRRTHMIMGRTVTIASRLVDMTADLAHPILVGEGLAAQTGAAGLQSMGTFLLDGLRVPHHVYAYPLFAAGKPE